MPCTQVHGHIFVLPHMTTNFFCHPLIKEW
jgi:hypothetical protein